MGKPVGGEIFAIHCTLSFNYRGPLHIRRYGGTFSQQEKAWGCSVLALWWETLVKSISPLYNR